MSGRAVPYLERLAAFVESHLGLQFPPDRRGDLQRRFAAAVSEFGCHDAASCTDWLLSTPPDAERLRVLAAHLTIGETYFFREQATLDALAQTVLPEMIRARRGRWQRLQLWSAGCCSGEEAYTLAILLHRLLPDRADWQLSLRATDLNDAFLRKAAQATYGPWSFRATPPAVHARYFEPARKGHHTVVPEIRRMVAFSRLNLVDGGYPSAANGTEALDLLLCRNVLMYFSPAQRQKVIDRLCAALAPGGWLVVSPSEASHANFPLLRAHAFPGAILFQKPEGDDAGEVTARAALLEPAAACTPVFDVACDDPNDTAPAPVLPHWSVQARELAGRGRLDEALACCERRLAADRGDASAHCLRGVVLLERGTAADVEAAGTALRRAVCLQPEIWMAQVALARLSRRLGQHARADRHDAHAALLRSQAADGAAQASPAGPARAPQGLRP